MTIKQRMMKKIESIALLRNGIIKLKNKLYLRGNTFEVSDIHFQRNTVDMQGKEQTFSCCKESYLRDGVVRMMGERNKVSIGVQTVVGGSDGQTFFVCGNDNRIIVGARCRINATTFFIRGHCNTIILGDDCSAHLAEFHVEGNGNTIQLGSGVTMHGRGNGSIHLAADEGSGIYIDDDCMIAHSVQMRSTDSHSIVDLNGRRLNPAADIRIGRHVWLGMQSIILKGCEIAPNTMVAAGSVCAARTERVSNCILAGNPAKVVKRDVNWDRKFV